MYTQCKHCKAIFSVNMREVTVAKGKLRCGECQQVFDVSDNLSTTMPAPYQENVENKTKTETVNDAKKVAPQPTAPENQSPSFVTDKPKSTLSKNGWLIISALLLSLLLLAQIFYYQSQHRADIPHEPDKIEMINHSVFSHPNRKGELIISANFKNTANHAQAYPVLEVRLTNNASKIIALRRFRPQEYLEKDVSNKLLPSNVITPLRLIIQDPGSQAQRFQFKFL